MTLKAAAIKVLERNRARNVSATILANPRNLHATTILKDYADEEEEKSKLLEALVTDTCRGLSITSHEVREALAPEDIEDWHKGDISTETRTAFARPLVQRQEMDQGKVPAEYTERATCIQCGPIWLWFAGEVLGCPWCWNRAADRPIPRPDSV